MPGKLIPSLHTWIAGTSAKLILLLEELIEMKVPEKLEQWGGKRGDR